MSHKLMNNAPNVIIDYSISFFTKLDLLMFSHTNKRFRKHSQNYILKYKNITFAINNNIHLKSKNVYIPKNELFCTDAAYEGYLNILIYMKNNININKLKICEFAAFITGPF